MRKLHRISVRLEDELWERLHTCAKEAEIVLSTVVRQALQAYLADADPSTNGPPKRPLAPPEEISPLLSKYWGWGDRSNDMRKERERLYRELLAASFACKKLYPLTPGLEESYIELRQLAKLFGIQENV